MFFRKMLVLVMLAVLSIPVMGYAQNSGEESLVLFIGTVTGVPDEFVGLAIEGENVTLYICDGKADEGTVSIAQWFVGTVADNTIDITAPNGNRVQVTLTEDAATGTFTFTDGSTRDFVLALAEGEAALYRSDFAFGDEEFVLGWLVLADGSLRGAGFVKSTGELFPATLERPGTRLCLTIGCSGAPE